MYNPPNEDELAGNGCLALIGIAILLFPLGMFGYGFLYQIREVMSMSSVSLFAIVDSLLLVTLAFTVCLVSFLACTYTLWRAFFYDHDKVVAKKWKTINRRYEKLMRDKERTG